MGHPTQNQLPIPLELAELLEPRIMRGVESRPLDGCWIRTTYVEPSTGYTRIHRQVGGKRSWYLAHRIMYVFAYGPIPDGYTVDHICEVRGCCNPAHLRAVPHHKNVLRSKTNFYAVNARKTECVRGHELPPHKVGGKRSCAPCNRIREAEYRARRRAERGAA